ncbi:MAG TPA: zeta toxin family protein [Rhizomicrobium sp.]
MTDGPVLLIVAGPNGSGKTTLTRQLRADQVDLGEYINPDDIAAALNGEYEARVAEAQRMADARRQDCLDRRASFSFETVMSHPSKIEVLKRARALGYFVLLFFVATESPELNVARVRQRVALGGHAVPEDRIVARYRRTMGLLPDAIANCDRVVLFDNSYRDEAGGARLEPFCEIVRTAGKPSITRLVEGRIPNWADNLVDEPVRLTWSRPRLTSRAPDDDTAKDISRDIAVDS